MNKLNYLLSCLSEECGELTQVIGKSQRFGINDINPKTKQPNTTELIKEFHDILAVYQMVLDEIGLDSKIQKELIDTKKKRVNYYMGYSITVGALNE